MLQFFHRKCLLCNIRKTHRGQDEMVGVISYQQIRTLASLVKGCSGRSQSTVEKGNLILRTGLFRVQVSVESELSDVERALKRETVVGNRGDAATEIVKVLENSQYMLLCHSFKTTMLRCGNKFWLHKI